ncbi:MAG TPA: hypothetical protein VJJ21_04385 [Candidatus Nanoarchaeia archaeon]|nr:hypothetical protein [Candidatus Nanoarchaeia archaeon]
MLVSNTSTLVLLAKAKCLEEFINLAPPIQIPREIEREAIFEKDSYDARLIDKLIKEGKIRIIVAEKEKIKKIINAFHLDEGEAAAYSLFNPRKHKAILTDDGELIKLCKLEKIPFLCAMAIVIRLYEKKKLSREAALNKLEILNKEGRYTKELYEHFKKEVK